MFLLCLFSNQTYRSSFDTSARLLASPDYTGLVCPRGHRMLERLYTESGRHCDMCETPLQEADTGHCCKVMCYAPSDLITYFFCDTLLHVSAL